MSSLYGETKQVNQYTAIHYAHHYKLKLQLLKEQIEVKSMIAFQLSIVQKPRGLSFLRINLNKE